ncbi:MAG: NAD-dependent epimerase/dehydratase family protein [Acidobacteriota bacterium]|nr:NAD-dependent epimerase/dehydratase family protein [Acidobacteriota bacterium]
MSDAKRILAITGASGFLGSEVVRLALRTGWRVRALSRSQDSGLPAQVEMLRSDYEDIAGMRRSFEGASVVLHCAGLAHVFGPPGADRDAFRQANEVVAACAAQAALAARVPHFILVSSVSVYGSREGDVCDETVLCQPAGPYACSKLAGELRVAEILEPSPTELTILRMATLYGAGDRGNIGKLAEAIGRGGLVLPGSGRNLKSILHKSDAARACLLVAERPSPARTMGVFNVAGAPQSMANIVSTVAASLKRRVLRVPLPDRLLLAVASRLLGLGILPGITSTLQKFLRNDAYSPLLFEQTYGFRGEVALTDEFPPPFA